ncbi:hypothetical protein RV08_GL001790 [Enterococcus mundtii]|nr:hypothetical protein RV08_GL001790 [Enterococcus mundtii]
MVFPLFLKRFRLFQALFSLSNGLAIFKEQYFEYKSKMNQRFF